MSQQTALRNVLAREIMRYEREVWKDDMRDPVMLAMWRTPRAMFYKQCARAWRDFALAVLPLGETSE